MITLQERFTSGVGGFVPPLNYIQLTRNDKVAVYQRSHSDGTIKDFETFLIKILPKGTQVFQTTTEDDEEKYAATSSFGRIAWSFHGTNGKQAAINKFNELNTAQAVKDDEETNESEVTNSNTTFIFPVGKFSTKDFAETNHCEYITASLFIKSAVNDGTIKSAGSERRNVKGKATNLFEKV